MKPGILVPFCVGCPPIADGVALTTVELEGIEVSRTELTATGLVVAELSVIVLGVRKAAVVVSSGE